MTKNQEHDDAPDRDITDRAWEGVSGRLLAASFPFVPFLLDSTQCPFLPAHLFLVPSPVDTRHYPGPCKIETLDNR